MASDLTGMEHRAHPPRRGGLNRGIAAVTTALLALSGCGGGDDSASQPTRSYTLHLRTDDATERYRYIAEDPIDLRVGDEVTFEVSNTGSLIHDLQVVAPDGEVVGVAAATNPGGTTSVTVLFEAPGYYRLNCLVDNHLTEHEMQAVVEVTEA